FLYRFTLEDRPREVRRTFRNKYDLLTAMIESQDSESATEALAELLQYDTLNNFETALLNVANFQYLTTFGGSDEDKLLLLRSALAYESYTGNVKEDEGFLPKPLRDSAMTHLSCWRSIPGAMVTPW